MVNLKIGKGTKKKAKAKKQKSKTKPIKKSEKELKEIGYDYEEHKNEEEKQISFKSSNFYDYLKCEECGKYRIVRLSKEANSECLFCAYPDYAEEMSKAWNLGFDGDLIEEFINEKDKHIIYHNTLTKGFIDFYYDNAGKKEEVNNINTDSDLIDEEIEELIADYITEVEMEIAVKNGKEKKKETETETETEKFFKDKKEKKNEEVILIEPKSNKALKMYNFILDEQFSELDKEKAIQELDNILRTIIKEKAIQEDHPSATDEALLLALESYGKKEEFEELINKTKKEKKKEKKKVLKEDRGKKVIIKESIKYFQKLEWLYKFMGKYMDFKPNFLPTLLTEEDEQMLEDIDSLVGGNN